jgi:hypothetical protein
MLRPAFLFVLVFALQGLPAQAIQSSGAAASILSPTSPGAGHGVPSSVNSVATPARVFTRGQSFPVIFGAPRSRRRPRTGVFLPVPIFIPAYPLVGDSTNGPPDQATADQADQQASANAGADDSGADNDALRQAYYQGAHDALAAAQQRSDNRYGEHYFDSREKGQAGPSAGTPSGDQQKDASGDEYTSAKNGPATVFVFKDGHKIETQNYAIQGQTLFDFSNNRLTKVKLAELDLDATKKANDELGITVRFPPPTPPSTP